MLPDEGPTSHHRILLSGVCVIWREITCGQHINYNIVTHKCHTHWAVSVTNWKWRPMVWQDSFQKQASLSQRQGTTSSLRKLRAMWKGRFLEHTKWNNHIWDPAITRKGTLSPTDEGRKGGHPDTNDIATDMQHFCPFFFIVDSCRATRKVQTSSQGIQLLVGYAGVGSRRVKVMHGN